MEFKLKGTSFKNEDGKDIQKILKREIKLLKDNDLIKEKYEGFSNREIKEMDLNVKEYSDISFYIKLKEDTFNNKQCVKIYIESFEGDYVHVGYIPKKMLSEYNKLKKDSTEIKGYAELIGGKYKHCVCYEEDYEEKCDVETVELSYGLNIHLVFHKNAIEEEILEEEKNEENSEIEHQIDVTYEKTEEVDMKHIILVTKLTLIILGGIIAICLLVEKLS